MKNIYIIIIAFLPLAHLQAQSLGTAGFTSGGNFAKKGGYTLSYTLGDMTAVQTVRANNNVLTQGILQPADIKPDSAMQCNVLPALSKVCKNSSQKFRLNGY